MSRLKAEPIILSNQEYEILEQIIRKHGTPNDQLGWWYRCPRPGTETPRPVPVPPARCRSGLSVIEPGDRIW